ncbi:MAG: AAA family ATPase [Bryobacteraceae bacterium]
MPPTITRVRLRDYRSIAACDVRLEPLTLLVGPNGSGKSNFLDSLRFITHCMHAPLEQVVEARSGIHSILRKQSNLRYAKEFSIQVEFAFPEGTEGRYFLRIGEGPDNAAVIEEEECRVGLRSFKAHRGRIEYDAPIPASTGDRPALVTLGSLPEFSSAFQLIANLGFYAPSPERMRRPAPPGAGRVLSRHGANAADVLWAIKKSRPEALGRICQYLATISPEFKNVEPRGIGDFRWLEFTPAAQPTGWLLSSADVSDGTLRAVAILLAVFQTQMPDSPLHLIGLEEPESNLHPAAAGVLLDALLEASRTVPIIASTHSADLLDRPDLPENALITVYMQDGVTVLAPVDESTKSILRRRLYTAGELLRSNQLGPSLGAMHE